MAEMEGVFRPRSPSDLKPADGSAGFTLRRKVDYRTAPLCGPRSARSGRAPRMCRYRSGGSVRRLWAWKSGSISAPCLWPRQNTRRPRRPLPKDEDGFPYQVILLLHPGGGGTKELKRDAEGRVLGWEMSADGKPGPGMRPVPSEVAEAAEEWLRDHRRDPKRFR